MTPRSLSHRAPLLGLALSWCAGSAAAHVGLVAWPSDIHAALALGGLAIAWLAGSRPLLWALGLCIALASTGALRTQECRARPHEWDALGLPPREAELRLRIDRLFALPTDEERAGGLARVVRAAPHLAELEGQRIQFFVTWPAGDGADLALPGREFTALGVLEPVPFRPGPGDPEFARYLAAEGVNFSFNRARLLDTPTPAGPWARFCADAGAHLERILRRGLGGSDALADLYVAMLLGKKSELSEAQRDRFIETGTMHLFAISGLHIAGIALAVNTVLTLLRLPGLGRFLVGTCILALYVQITGAAPSAVRAFWMVTCLLGARQIRAPSNSLAALSLSALCVLVITPHQLFTAGFQMSYGIVAALLLYGVPLQERWLAAWQPWANLPKSAWTLRHHVTEWIGRGLLGAIALGLAATLVSTPATVAFSAWSRPAAFSSTSCSYQSPGWCSSRASRPCFADWSALLRWRSCSTTRPPWCWPRWTTW